MYVTIPKCICCRPCHVLFGGGHVESALIESFFALLNSYLSCYVPLNDSSHMGQ